MYRNGKRLCTLTVILLWGLLLLPLSTFGASTGSIKGLITDKASGEPVIGASVAIVGSSLGAQTGIDGRFSIRQLEPGIYTVRISSIEYSTVKVTDIQVKADLSTDVDQALEKKVSELDNVIIVIGQQTILNLKETSNQITLTAKDIQTRPVTSVDDILTQVAGVQTTNKGEVFIRGGRAGEISYIVDGVPIGDPLAGAGQAGANMSLVSGSIAEIQIIKDGFDPEYGNALSGIVKITTQTGAKDNSRMDFEFQTDDFGSHSLNKYSRNSDFFKFSMGGPDPFFTDKFLPALGINFLEGKEFTYYFYADVSKNDGFYQYDDYTSPITTRESGGFSLFGIDIPERLNNRYYYMANLKFRPKQSLKFIISYKNSRSQNTDFSWESRYSPNTATFRDNAWQTLSLEVTQALSTSMNYEFIFSYYNSKNTRSPSDPNNPGHGLDPYDFTLDLDVETFQDMNDNGVYDAPEPILNLFPDSATYGTNFAGGGYTDGERLFLFNSQGAVFDYYPFTLNNNGYIDNLEGEPFIDLNGNGVWDAGDILEDKNGNGIYDIDRSLVINQRNPEPFIDGDRILGEPFTDVNRNGVYDRGIDVFTRSSDPLLNHDKNYNGVYDGPCEGVLCAYEPGRRFEDRNGNGLYDSPNHTYDPGEPFTDNNGNGVWDDGGQNQFLDPGSFTTDSRWNLNKTRRYRAELKVFREMGNHELKGGLAVQREKLIYQDIQFPYLPYTGRADGGPFASRGALRDIWEVRPWEGTFYFRDKIEYGSMIANLGLRLDFFLQDTEALTPIAQQESSGDDVILGDRHKLSPRIGFSYPISDKAKVHFNYGHFFQLPGRNFMFARNTQSVNVDDVSGNYNLDYQKTIQYSFGVKYKLDENYSLDISSYFKDEFDKVNQAEVETEFSVIRQYLNVDYGRAKGFEMELAKHGGGFVNGQISYTYAFATGKASETAEIYLTDIARQPLSEAPLDTDIRHSFKSAIQIYVPETVKPRVFGLPIPNDWSIDISAVVQSGRPFTPAATLPGVSSGTSAEIARNSMRYPSTAVFDVRFNKNFGLAGVDMTYILWIENVFDTRNVENIYTNTGRPDTQQNASGIISGGKFFDQNPNNWDYGRQIKMGFTVSL